jgi:hypothetical protein
MNREALFLESEIRELENLMASLPANNIIERMSLDARLDTVKAELAALSHREANDAR